MTRSLAIELLDKVNNPDHSTYHDFDDDDPEVGTVFYRFYQVVYVTYVYISIYVSESVCLSSGSNLNKLLREEIPLDFAYPREVMS